MHTTLWLRHRTEGRGGRSWRTYTIHAPDGAVVYTASARRVPGPIEVWSAGAAPVEVVRARPRRSFPLTGRYDVVAPPDTHLGVITRGCRIYDAAGSKVGRYRDQRTMKEHIGEGILTMVVEGIIAGDAASGDARGASGYILVLAGRAPGRLARARLPFEPPAPPRPEPGRAAATLRRVLPRRARALLFERGETHGWMLDVPDPGEIAPPLLLASALLAIELALW